MVALELVLKWHKNQMRSGALNGVHLPFLVHPISVMKTACMCHDTKEDTEITWKELREVIGDEATNIVAELTYEGNTPEEKAEYIKSFREKSIEALVIKIADRLNNVKDFILTKPEYANKYFNKAESLFEALVDRKEELDVEVWSMMVDDIDETQNNAAWAEELAMAAMRSTQVWNQFKECIYANGKLPI